MLNIIGTIDKPTKGEMNLAGHCTPLSLYIFLFHSFLMIFAVINHKTDDLTLAMLRLKKMYVFIGLYWRVLIVLQRICVSDFQLVIVSYCFGKCGNANDSCWRSQC